MIEFVTLFLGLYTGQLAVELAVAPAVVTVEVRLDGRVVGTLWGEPWTLVCDLGEELAPHQLVAVAYDDEKHEIARARTRINLPRPAATARFVLEPGAARGPPTARLTWEPASFDQPEAVRVTFDGEALRANDLRRIKLPPHDPGRAHFLYAELVFLENVEAHAELVFGGPYRSPADAELTAVMVSWQSRPAPRAEALAGMLIKDGRPLQVVAVDHGPADLLVVRDRSPATLDRLRSLSEQRPRLPSMRFHSDDRMRFVVPASERRVEPWSETHQLPLSSNLAGFGKGVLLTILGTYALPGDGEPEPSLRIADAVAIAGFVAAAGNRRRAVLLIHPGETADTSRYRPENVEGYLRKLQVPLRIWIPDPGPGDRSRWQGAEVIATRPDTRRAFQDLGQVLDSQYTVWVEGRHLPGEIRLAASAVGIRLVE